MVPPKNLPILPDGQAGPVRMASTALRFQKVVVRDSRVYESASMSECFFFVFFSMALTALCPPPPPKKTMSAWVWLQLVCASRSESVRVAWIRRKKKKKKKFNSLGWSRGSKRLGLSLLEEESIQK